ncbi:MAG: hypothetical protein MUO78_08195 [candidate division Zixibacteria bacterium]|nr:hypothetical protein [candidate division Zixibacteria bacterium]
MLRLKSKFHLGLTILVLFFLSGRDCLAQEQSKGEASFSGALLSIFILLVLGGGIFFALKIHSLLKGGELSSAWVLSSTALSILFVSIFLEFLSSLGVINSVLALVLLLQFFGFILLVFGFILIKKKLG